MAGEEGSWRTAAFRQSVVSKIDEAIQRSGMPTAKNSVEMENHVFQKAKTKEEYLSFVARLILHVRELNAKKGQGMNGPAGGAGQTMQDPINALQTLARQGTGNAQMIGLGPQAAGMVPQPPNQIPASNLLQTLNQRPGQPLGGLTSLQNKVPDLGLGPGAQFEEGNNMENEAIEDTNLNPHTPTTPSSSSSSSSSSSTPVTPTTARFSNSNKSVTEASCGKRKRPMEDRTSEILSMAGNKVNSIQAPDTFDTFGQHVANKLRAFTPQQNLLAQKLINDVLSEGNKESLNENFKVVEIEATSNIEG